MSDTARNMLKTALRHQLESQRVEWPHQRSLTADELEIVCKIAIDINPHMDINMAVSIFDAGYADAYINSPETRLIIDMWVKSAGFADLDLDEFISSVQANKT